MLSDGFEEDLLRALQLVHSTKPGSTDELRALLEASIARRCRDHVVESESDRRRDGGFTDSRGIDVAGRDEVPRISIPDEEQADGAVCKVCNVPEFGLLMLIQCQKCSEMFHPLCHQPPVNDLRINDSDFSWRCRKCDEKSLVKDHLLGKPAKHMASYRHKNKKLKKQN